MAAINKFRVLMPMEKSVFALPALKKPKVPKMPKAGQATKPLKFGKY